MSKYAGYRIRQWIVCHGQNLLRWNMPQVLQESGSLMLTPEILMKQQIKKVLLITTEGMVRRGTLDELFLKLQRQQIQYHIFDQVKPDPAIGTIEKAVALYQKQECQGILAIGGGSVLDCGKLTGARVARPDRTIQQMGGMMKVRRKLPFFIAVPTTAGTGSEVTVAAVVTEEETHLKYAVSDLCLMPAVAVLDPELLTGLPKTLTAETGMDALTHAVEAYLNRYAPKEVKKDALEAVKLIMKFLPESYQEGDKLSARAGMLEGSYLAGRAFTRAYVGYVHALAHAIGGIYGISHGKANGVLLPRVLEAYGVSVYPELAELADAAGIEGETTSQKAEQFLQVINDMQQSMGIPSTLEEIQEKDFDLLVNRAMKEANPAYPVPVIWDKETFLKVLEKTAGKKGQEE